MLKFKLSVMKELSYEKMEKMSGGLNCFFAIPAFLLSITPFDQIWSATRIYLCYNNENKI